VCLGTVEVDQASTVLHRCVVGIEKYPTDSGRTAAESHLPLPQLGAESVVLMIDVARNGIV
jgi:hypothetical protein